MPRISAESDQLDSYYNNGNECTISNGIDLCRDCWRKVNGWSLETFKDYCANPDHRFGASQIERTDEPWQTGQLWTLMDNGHPFTGEAAPRYQDTYGHVDEYQCECCGSGLKWKDH